MQNLLDNPIVVSDIKETCNSEFVEWVKLRKTTVAITGITGMIGSFLARTLIFASEKYDLNIKIIGLVRNEEKANVMFNDELSKKYITFRKVDLNKPIEQYAQIDYLFHCAHNTDSKSMVQMPVETLEVASVGTKNVLEFAKQSNVKSFVYLSSMEVYGQTDNKMLSEEDLGNIDIFNIRNSYSLGKRISEALCYFYNKEYNLPVKIVRLAQVISSSTKYDDNRVFGYFSRSVVENSDIILKTTGETVRSYVYIVDAISGMPRVLLSGENGVAYNVNNEDYTMMICEVANIISIKSNGVQVVIDIDENSPYPKSVNWSLSNRKIKSLGWDSSITFDEALSRVIKSFEYQKNN